MRLNWTMSKAWTTPKGGGDRGCQPPLGGVPVLNTFTVYCYRMDDASIEIGSKIKRIRRHRVTDSKPIEIHNSKDFMDYILKHGTKTSTQSKISKRYDTSGFVFTGSISPALFHIFGVGQEILGSSYRPNECNLFLGKITF